MATATPAISRVSEVAPQLTSVTRAHTSTARFYQPELDVLRFFAFLCVFLHHGLPSFGLSGHPTIIVPFLNIWNNAKSAGGFGVCLFFLLSSFLITELLERERLHTRRIHVASFYMRRILRIWPLYFGFIGAAAFVAFLWSAYRPEPGRLMALLLLMGNWYTAAHGVGGNLLGPLWSISVEEQFYLVWPWLAKLGRKTIYGISLGLLPCSWIAIFLVGRAGDHTSFRIWLNSFVQFQFFGLGALLALFFKGRTPKFRLRFRLALFVSALLVWYLAQSLFHVKDDSRALSASFGIPGYALIGAGCILLLLSFLGISERLVPNRLVYLGKISYGLYVFHLFALDCTWTLRQRAIQMFGTLGSIKAPSYLIACVIALGLSISMAVVSYRFLEQPFLRLKRRFAIIESRGI